MPNATRRKAVHRAPASAEFLIVGVGASAGGLQAFSEILSAVPAKPGLALIFVQHLDPKHPSLLPQLLAHAGKLDVREISDGEPIAANCVYVGPPAKLVQVEGGRLRLAPRNEDHAWAIDVFFRSLAADQKQRAVGVVLSGNGLDGANGLGAIKSEGGLTFAQEEASARFTGMPHAAITAGHVDMVLAPRQIASALVNLAKHPRAVALGLAAARTGSEPIQAILGLVRQHNGVDFSQYRGC